MMHIKSAPMRFDDIAGSIEAKAIMAVALVAERLLAPLGRGIFEGLLRLADREDEFAAFNFCHGGDAGGLCARMERVGEKFQESSLENLWIDFQSGAADVRLPVDLAALLGKLGRQLLLQVLDEG